MSIEEQCQKILSEAQTESDRIKKSVNEFYAKNKENPEVGSKIEKEFSNDEKSFKSSYYPSFGLENENNEFVAFYDICNEKLKVIYDDLIGFLEYFYRKPI